MYQETTISEAEVLAIAKSRQLVKFPNWVFIVPILIVIALILSLIITKNIAFAIGLYLVGLAFGRYVNQKIVKPAHKAFVEHWMQTGRLHPTEWRYR